MFPSRNKIITLCICCVALSILPATSFGMKILKKGDTVGIFYVTKIAGAEADGVEPGQRLCYRCRYGSRPIVMIFARKTGRRLTDLVQYLDQAIAVNPNARLKGLVTLLGKDQRVLKEAAQEVADTALVKEIPVAIATEQGIRSNQYQLPEDAEVTIVVAKDSRVVHTLVFDVNEIDLATIEGEVSQLIR